jgi:hypothetical protein
MLDELEFDPLRAGIQHPSFPNFWVYETPRMNGIPTVFILYEIDATQRIATLWSLAVI